MIPQAAITEWRNLSPWENMHNVEQDLLISRALIAISSDDMLANALAFRGGTALHKLFLKPQERYSEDLDFVQIKAAPIGKTLDRLRIALSFLDALQTKRKKSNNVVLCKFSTTFPPVVDLTIKIEINCKEHFSILGYEMKPFSIDNLWFTGDCETKTFCLEELLATKLRALYQRKKGRDLFDLSYALLSSAQDLDKVIECYKHYITFPDNHLPTSSEYHANLEAKIMDPIFRLDATPILRPGIEYDIDAAYENVVQAYVSRMQ